MRADDRELPALTVGPVTVHPDYQRRGIGRAMIGRVAELGRVQGSVAIVILEPPHDYVRYGFKNGKTLVVTGDGT